MKIMIVDWGEDVMSGHRYTAHPMTKTIKAECFNEIDRTGDPYCTKYKIFPYDECYFPNGISCQEELVETYNEKAEDGYSVPEEKDFDNYNI